MIDDTHTRPQAALLLTNDVADVEELPYLRYTEVVLERGHAHLRALRFATEARLDALVSDALASSRGLYRQTAAFELGPGATAHVSVSGGVLSAELAASDLDGLDAAEEWVRGAFPQLVQDEARSVSVRFWSTSSRGPRTFARTIAVPGWEEIDGNYPAAVRAGLERLLASPPRAAGGQLILWHGEPGTGKTHALRALGWEWREWCDLHYVTDPERFFGESAYMLDVLLRDDEEDDADLERWRLLVLEDTGELLASDAKERTGQGLSRLLNVVDGLIGQGLRVLVLVTTNEDLRSLHPALARPGRCAACLEFAAFPGPEADAWLRAQGAAPLGRAATLATLFAHRSGADVSERRRPVGFVHA
jgi:Domain of unknown function (DUF5925)/ATPase family associated with various cellular activities (AAA)